MKTRRTVSLCVAVLTLVSASPVVADEIQEALRDRIDKVIDSAKMTTVTLAEPLTVFLLY